MANANRGTPIGVQDTSGSAFDVGPDVGRVREIEVGTKAVFNPRVLAVDFIDGAVAAGNGIVTKELVHRGDTQISRVAVFRALHAEHEASTSHQAVAVVKAIDRAVGERQVVSIHMRVGKFNLWFEVEGLCDVEAPAEFARERGDDIIHRALLVPVNRHVCLGRA